MYHRRQHIDSEDESTVLGLQKLLIKGGAEMGNDALCPPVLLPATYSHQANFSTLSSAYDSSAGLRQVTS